MANICGMAENFSLKPVNYNMFHSTLSAKSVLCATQSTQSKWICNPMSTGAQHQVRCCVAMCMCTHQALLNTTSIYDVILHQI